MFKGLKAVVREKNLCVSGTKQSNNNCFTFCTHILVCDAQETTYEHQTSLLSSAVINNPLTTL